MLSIVLRAASYILHDSYIYIPYYLNKPLIFARKINVYKDEINTLMCALIVFQDKL